MTPLGTLEADWMIDQNSKRKLDNKKIELRHKLAKLNEEILLRNAQL